MDEIINEIIAKVLKISIKEIHDDLKMGEVATWDSLSHMDLIVALETSLNVCFTGDEIADMITIGTIRSIIKEKVKGNELRR